MMENNTNQMNGKIALLKESRLQLLRLHKLLVDIERERFEKENGQITSGQFLNLLLNDENLQWLRKFSTLIVEVDEMFDLDDGFSDEMVERHLSEMKKIVELKTSDADFNDIYRKFLADNSDVANKNRELETFLSTE